MPHPSPQIPSSTESLGCFAGLVRITWLFLGNFIPFFLALFIALESGFSAYDVAFWASIAGLSLVRYIDITRLHGLTADAQPATLRDWRRYTFFLLLISAGVWGVAHLV